MVNAPPNARNGARNRFVSKSRAAGIGEADARKAWRPVIEQARDHAARVLAGQPIGRFEAADLVGLVVKLKARFPVAHAAAQDAAAGFLALARGFAVAARPQDREALAPVVLAAAKCLDDLITAQGHALAAWSRRVAGEVEE